MNTVEELKSGLANFCGTEAYHKYMPGMVLTDGALWLAQNAGCFWLMDIAWSVLGKPAVKASGFLAVKLKKTATTKGCTVRVEDGDENLLYSEKIGYTDFPFDEYTFFVQWGGDFWVAMLTSEY